MPSRSRVGSMLAAALAMLAMAAGHTRAIEIIFEPLNQTTHPLIVDGTWSFTANNPGYDSDASGLANILDHVKDVYEVAFQDSQTIRITYWWDEDMTAGGQSIPALIFENPEGTLTHAVVRFNATRTFYVDPTPWEDNLFPNMTQRLYDFGPGALAPADQAARFTGDVPAVFEAGFWGSAVADSDADGVTDLLSLAFHEVGHSLGMNAGFSGLQDQIANGQFDMDPNWVRGAVMGLLPRGVNPDPLDHLAGNDAVMGFLSGSRRTRPSVADYLGIASSQGWTIGDLPRVDFLGGNDWNTGFNWIGGQVPLHLTDAFIRHGGVVFMSGPGNVSSLTLDDGSSLQNSNEHLFAERVTLTNTTGVPITSRLVLAGTGMLIADEVDVGDTTSLDVFGAGAIANVSHRLRVHNGGQLRGFGTVNISGMFGELINDGAIHATSGGTLVFASPNHLALNLDGVSNNGIVLAMEGNIHFQTGFAGPFNSVMNVGEGRHVTFDDSISFGAGSLLHLAGGAMNPATVNGPGIIFLGWAATLRGTELAVVNNTLFIGDGAIVESNPGSSELRLNGLTVMEGGSILGPGVVRQNGDLVVTHSSTINPHIYDMDGQAGNTHVTIEPGARLNVLSSQIAMSPINDFTGTIQLNGGELHVAPSWRLDGTMNMHETAGSPATLSGAGGVSVALPGKVHVLGQGQVDTAAAIGGTVFVGEFPDPGHLHLNGMTLVNSTAHFEVDSQSVLSFNAHTTLAGGTFVGAGLVEFNDVVHVVANTSISTAETDLDGSTESAQITINPDIIFSIFSNTIEPGRDDGFDGVITNHGVLYILPSWRLDHLLHMIEPPGRTLIPTVDGVGLMHIYHTGLMTTDGDALVNPPLLVDGSMQIDNGTTWINNVSAYSATASVDVSDTAVLILDGASSFAGGSYTGDGLMRFNGEVEVVDATTMDVLRLDLDGVANANTWTLHDAPLTLNAQRLNATNNIFSGVMNLDGPAARLTVNLIPASAAWQLGGNGIINIDATGFPPPTMLAGSPLIVHGRINVDGRVRFEAQTAFRGRLQLESFTTDVHFGGGDFHLVYDTAIFDGFGSITIDDGTAMYLEHASHVGVSVENHGRLEVGFLPTDVIIDFVTPGQATIRGNFSQLPTGVHRTEVAGLSPGTGHDQLVVTGEARLGGTLEIAVIHGHEPALFDAHAILTAANVVDTFDHVDQSDVDPAHVFHVAYSPVDVRLLYLLLGDMNLDGSVDAGDVAAFVMALSDPAAYEAQYGITPDFVGDINRDNAFDTGDVAAFVELLVGAASVPEPATLGLLAMGWLMAVRRRR